MSLFYLPIEPTTFSHPHHPRHHHHQHLSQPSCPRFEAGFPPQQQFFNSFELDHLSQPFLFSPPHHPRHPHHHHQRTSSYQSPQSLAISPIEARKQRLLAEFAQSLDQLYPSTSPSSTRQVVVAAPSYDRERIRYLEAQLKEEKIRKALEAERIKLTKAKGVQKRREEQEERRAAAVVEKHRQELQHASLAQQHCLLQQQQHHQQQVEASEEQQRRRLLEHRQRQQSSGLGGLERLFALLSGSEPPRREVEQPRPQPQQKKTMNEHALGGLDQLLAFAQALENRPVPRAGDSGSEVASSESKNVPQQSSSRPTSLRKPLPPSPLATLRSLQTQLHSLLTSTASTSTVLAHRLEKLLIDADGLESGGDEVVRRERKKFVQEVERALKSLEEKESVTSSKEDPTEFLAPTVDESTRTASEVVVPSSSDSPSSPSVVVASDLSPSTPLDDVNDDGASDTSSNVSELSERSSAVSSKSKGKRRAASVEDEEVEEEKYEFV